MQSVWTVLIRVYAIVAKCFGPLERLIAIVTTFDTIVPYNYAAEGYLQAYPSVQCWYFFCFLGNHFVDGSWQGFFAACQNISCHFEFHLI